MISVAGLEEAEINVRAALDDMLFRRCSTPLVDVIVRTRRVEEPAVNRFVARRAVVFATIEQVGGQVAYTDSWGLRPLSPGGGQISYFPAGATGMAHFEKIELLRDCAVSFDGGMIDQILSEDREMAQALTKAKLMAPDPVALQLCDLLAGDGQGQDQGSASSLFIDSLACALLARIARLSCADATGGRKGGLSPWQLRRVTDYIRAHLGETMELKSLSDLVELSPSYFIRAFKASTGYTPYSWLRFARIDRVKELLLRGTDPLVEVAYVTGYADQAHLTRAFHHATGTSPAAWRRARKHDGKSRDSLVDQA